MSFDEIEVIPEDGVQRRIVVSEAHDGAQPRLALEQDDDVVCLTRYQLELLLPVAQRFLDGG